MIADADLVHADLPDTVAAVHTFAEPYLAAGPAPEFGSAAWCELAVDDPARRVAIVRAAVAWWSATVFGSGVPENVLHRLVGDELKAISTAVAEALDWKRVAGRPPHAQLERRRDEPGRAALAWRERHGGEHGGGPVSWSSRTEAAA